MNLIEAMSDPRLFGPWFEGSSWKAWKAFLACLFGLPLSPDQRAVVTACTGLETPPDHALNEAWLVCGRRSGKSRIAALIAVFLATFQDWRPYLAPGERGTILVLAVDRRQARTIMRYVSGLLESVPALRAMVGKTTAEEIELNNQVTIEISTASFRSVRGYTILAALCDEVSYWRSDESANPDREILDALRPAMATVPGAMLLCASSPYSRRGALWDAYRRWHGQADAPALIWHADTRTMNPSIDGRIIAEAYERDPAWAAAEYGAQFRTDIDTFVAQEVIDSCTIVNRYECRPIIGTNYSAFADPSGGSSDSFALAIAHCEGDIGVLDVIREVRPPFSPDAIVGEFAALCLLYGISSISGDRYGGEWVAERFKQHAIRYEPAEKPKSDIYREALPLLNAGRVELLDNSRLRTQLIGLERRTARGGRDSIDHPPGGHDDIANAVCGVLVKTAGKMSPLEIWRRCAGIPA